MSDPNCLPRDQTIFLYIKSSEIVCIAGKSALTAGKTYPGFLEVFSQDGELLWSASASWAFQAVSVAPDGSVYAGTFEGEIMRYNPEGNLIWSTGPGFFGWYTTPTYETSGGIKGGGHTFPHFCHDLAAMADGGVVGAASEHDGSGTVGGSAGQVVKLNSNGTRAWSWHGFSHSARCVAGNWENQAYVGSIDRTGVQFDASGGVSGEYSFDQAVEDVAVDMQGNPHWAVRHNYHITVDPNGTVSFHDGPAAADFDGGVYETIRAYGEDNTLISVTVNKSAGEEIGAWSKSMGRDVLSIAVSPWWITVPLDEEDEDEDEDK